MMDRRTSFAMTNRAGSERYTHHEPAQSIPVIPANAGIQTRWRYQPRLLDSRLRGNDGKLLIARSLQAIACHIPVRQSLALATKSKK